MSCIILHQRRKDTISPYKYLMTYLSQIFKTLTTFKTDENDYFSVKRNQIYNSKNCTPLISKMTFWNCFKILILVIKHISVQTFNCSILFICKTFWIWNIGELNPIFQFCYTVSVHLYFHYFLELHFITVFPVEISFHYYLRNFWVYRHGIQRVL